MALKYLRLRAFVVNNLQLIFFACFAQVIEMSDDDGCVCRLRGLPWSATSEDVTNFFESKYFMPGFFSLILINYII